MQNGELDGVSPKVIVLQAGTNNLPWEGHADQKCIDDVCEGIAAILHEFQQRTPQATILLTAIFPRPQNPSLAPAIETINHRLQSLTDNKRVRWLNINDSLVDSEGRFRDGMSSDGIHLEKPGYEVWASALKPLLTEILGPPSADDLAPPATGIP
jgi:lysophospholipase L1-like esterase